MTSCPSTPGNCYLIDGIFIFAGALAGELTTMATMLLQVPSAGSAPGPAGSPQ